MSRKHRRRARHNDKLNSGIAPGDLNGQVPSIEDGVVKVTPATACSGVYIIVNSRNGNCYVGSSANVLKRVWTHLNGKPGKASASIIAAMAKHGREAFDGYMLEQVKRGRLPTCEAKWIKKLRPAYNRSDLTDTGGRLVSPATREKLRQANLGKKMAPHLIEQQRQRLLGHTVSAETREKIRQTKIGKTHAESTKARMSATWHRSAESLEKMAAVHRGRKHSDETREKRSKALRGKPWSPARRAAFVDKEYRL